MLPPEILCHMSAKLLALWQLAFAGVASSPQHIEQIVRDAFDEDRAIEQLQLFKQLSGEDLRNKQLLEIGSGVGLTLAVSRLQYTAQAFGVEPASAQYEGMLSLAHDLLVNYGLPPTVIQGGVGEYLPYRSNTFDAVISSNVLEHVRNPEGVLDESLRVLRPGGILQFVVPNYGSWWEGHYGLLWLPNTPKWLARWYVRVCGRDPSFLDTLQFINRAGLEEMLSKYRGQIQILSWGEGVWEERVRTLGFSEWAALGKLKGMVRWIHRLGLVDAVVWLGKRLHWETPLILTLRKLTDVSHESA